MPPASDSAVPHPARRLCRREHPLSDRIRLALLFLVVVACVTARVGGALGAPLPARAGRTVASAAPEQTKVVRYARRFLGVRYVYGGSSPSGFDCSGFTRYVFAHFGIDLPHYAAGQFDLGRKVSRAALRPGDLVFFDRLGHVGLYVGGGRFIHAPHTGTRVEVDSLSGSYGAGYDGARRIL